MKLIDVICFALVTFVTGLCVLLFQEHRIFPALFATVTFHDVIAFGMFVTLIFVIRDRKGHA